MGYRYVITKFYTAGPLKGESRQCVTNHLYQTGRFYTEGDRSSHYQVTAIHDFREGRYLEAA
jgi:hypothetical protein